METENTALKKKSDFALRHPLLQETLFSIKKGQAGLFKRGRFIGIGGVVDQPEYLRVTPDGNRGMRIVKTKGANSRKTQNEVPNGTLMNYEDAFNLFHLRE